ncbi:response regulator transcription factor [Caenispirillum bisanense]|uniref:Response regulator receiver domain-containing protein n=1 Tax=Caenispirillum bisanense TaxID=414052 RepID=A0A286GN74_9PROT|nr:response regulator [Caenispirillum bisanense]MCA1974193.1 response regulator [Caenispirillum sp.]SOD96993.1 Response regulator receiver domain-containing protein [Caenispirillum bisanense]
MTTILIVDDSRVARLSLRRLVLKLVPDAEIIEAASADEAAAAVDGVSVDRALIDFNMPGRNGLELAEQLAAEHAEIRMAMVTANIQDAVAGRAEALGMSFIAKPPREEDMQGFLLGAGQGAA